MTALMPVRMRRNSGTITQSTSSRPNARQGRRAITVSITRMAPRIVKPPAPDINPRPQDFLQVSPNILLLLLLHHGRR